MADLITSARAQYNLNNYSLSSNESTTLSALITACSKAIQKFCGRDFVQAQYDELYNGEMQLRLILRQYPVISVARVAYNPIPVLNIMNTGAANQRANVAVTSTGITLNTWASGVQTTDTSTAFATYTTLSSVASHINGLGNGWSASFPNTTQYANWPSADLRSIQGALNAMNIMAPLRIHTSELQDFQVDLERGWLVRNQILDDTLIPPLGMNWHGGINFWRVIYTAGFASVPDDVAEACAQWVAALFWQTKRDPGLLQESIPGAVSRSPFSTMPPGVRELLLPYKARRLMSLGG
jgi:hypothetical protein